MFYDIPSVGDQIKVFIHERKGGGYYVGKVIHVATLYDERSFALVKLLRKYQQGTIQPVDLKRDHMQIPLYVKQVWEHF